MKQLILLLSFFFLVFSDTTAQRWNLVNKNSIDFIIGGELSVRFLQDKGEDEMAHEYLIFRERREGTKPNLRIGFNYNLALNENLIFKTGARLTNPGFSAKGIYEALYEDYAGPAFLQNATAYDYRYLFLEMPLMVRYIYSENWCKSYIEAGFSANYYIHTRITAHYRDDSELLKIKEDITPVNLSGNFSIGAEFMIGQVPAFIQLISRIQFTPFEHYLIQEYFFNAGLETGVRYAF